MNKKMYEAEKLILRMEDQLKEDGYDPSSKAFKALNALKAILARDGYAHLAAEQKTICAAKKKAAQKKMRAAAKAAAEKAAAFSAAKNLRILRDE